MHNACAESRSPRGKNTEIHQTNVTQVSAVRTTVFPTGESPLCEELAEVGHIALLGQLGVAMCPSLALPVATYIRWLGSGALPAEGCS